MPFPDSNAAWLYRVVRNAAINRGKSERRRAEHEQFAAQRWVAKKDWFAQRSLELEEQKELDSFLKSNSSTHPQLSGGLKSGRQNAVSFLVTGSPETRRVVREMFSDLPKPFEEATGELLADKVAWGGLFVELPPVIDLEVVVQTTTVSRLKRWGVYRTLSFATQRKMRPRIWRIYLTNTFWRR